MANFIFGVFLILVLSYFTNTVDGKATFKEIHVDVDGLNKPAVKTIQVKVFIKTRKNIRHDVII